MKLCLKKVKLFDVQDYFEATVGRRPGSRSMSRLKPYMVRSNIEASHGIYRKLSSKYKFPIWVNVRTASLFNRASSGRLSNAYYLYVKDGSAVVDFLGVCFVTPTKDLVFSLKYRKASGYLRALDFSDLRKVSSLESF